MKTRVKNQNNKNGAIPKQNNKINKGKKTYSSIVKSQRKKVTKENNEDQNKTFESHPNLSRFKKQGKKDSRELSNIISESDWSSVGLSESELVTPSLSEGEESRDGPLQLAPDPSKRFFTKEKNNEKTVQNPQRAWEPENYPSCSYTSQQVNNWPINCRNEGSHNHRTSNTGPDPPFKGQGASSQGPKLVEKRSYHISSVGVDGEEVIEEKSVKEDGFQVYHSSAYKKKMK